MRVNVKEMCEYEICHFNSSAKVNIKSFAHLHIRTFAHLLRICTFINVILQKNLS